MAYTLLQSVDDFTPSIVLIGVPDKKALEKVIKKLKMNRIESSAFYESDDDIGLSAVVTVPLNEEQRAILQNYKLWNENNLTYAPSSVVRAPLLSDGGRWSESIGAYQLTPLSATEEDGSQPLRTWTSSGHGAPPSGYTDEIRFDS